MKLYKMCSYVSFHFPTSPTTFLNFNVNSRYSRQCRYKMICQRLILLMCKFRKKQTIWVGLKFSTIILDRSSYICLSFKNGQWGGLSPSGLQMFFDLFSLWSHRKTSCSFQIQCWLISLTASSCFSASFCCFFLSLHVVSFPFSET